MLWLTRMDLPVCWMVEPSNQYDDAVPIAQITHEKDQFMQSFKELYKKHQRNETSQEEQVELARYYIVGIIPRRIIMFA